jgi:eukaryotic-like serine/threonine-protein kinase
MTSIDEFPRKLGRYDLYDQIAAGGMATVHFGRMHGAVGFQRVVAIKRLHTHYAHDAHFVDMFIDEARLASRLTHPNVISTLDVVADEAEVFLVMEFVLGESLEALMPRGSTRAVPLPIVASILCDVLEGLHGAHASLSDTGEPLGIVHRDVSPHNVLVGDDGVSRVFDFGIAKAAINTQETRDGVIKGKVTYMAPEQVRGGVDRRSDIYAAGVILWELLVGRRRHTGERNDALFLKLATNTLEPPPPASTLRLDVPEALDDIIARATSPDPADRFDTAREMAMAIEAVVRPAMAREVSDWVRDVAGERIELLADVMKRIESSLPPRSEPTLSTMPRPSTDSIRVVTSSLTRAGGVASSVPPSEVDGSVTQSIALPPPPPRRSWTLPASLLAFSAAMLLVGLRVLSGRGAEDAQERTEASTRAARLGPATEVALTSSSSAASPSRGGETSADASSSGQAEATTTTGASLAGDAASTAPPLAKAHTPPSNAAPARTPPQAAPARPIHAAAPVTTQAPAPPSPPATTPAATLHKSCESPFVVGADGIRQIKPECM